jgi:hypothetical protein
MSPWLSGPRSGPALQAVLRRDADLARAANGLLEHRATNGLRVIHAHREREVPCDGRTCVARYLSPQNPYRYFRRREPSLAEERPSRETVNRCGDRAPADT